MCNILKPSDHQHIVAMHTVHRQRRQQITTRLPTFNTCTQLLLIHHCCNNYIIILTTHRIITPQDTPLLALCSQPRHLICDLVLSPGFPGELNPQPFISSQGIDGHHNVSQCFVTRVPLPCHQLDYQLTVHTDLHKVPLILPPLCHHKLESLQHSKHLRLV